MTGSPSLDATVVGGLGVVLQGLRQQVCAQP